MARHSTRLRLSLSVFAVAFLVCMAVGTMAFAAPGDSEPNALDLAPYQGSSLTTTLVGPTGAGLNTCYYFKLYIPAGETLRAEFIASPSVLNLQAIVFYGTYPSSVPVSASSARLTYTAPVSRMYTIYAAASSTGTFTVAPCGFTSMSGTSGTRITSYNAATALYGYLNSGATSLDKNVSLYSSTNKSSWGASSVPITKTTLGDGSYRYRATVNRTSTLYYRFRFAGDSEYGPSWGPIVTVAPKVYLSTPSTPSHAHRGRSFTTSAYLKSRHAAGTKPVKFYYYRWNGKSYSYVKSAWATASNYSTYSKVSAKTSLSSTGKWRVRAYHPADSKNSATYGAYRYFTVQN